MEGVLGIFQGILSTNDDYFKIYLNALDEHQSFHSKSSVDGVVQHISSTLSNPRMYREALILLNCYIKQVSVEELEQKAVLWTTLTVKTLNSKDIEAIVELVYSALGSLALNSLRVPELSKSFAHNHLCKIYESLCKSSPSGYLEALKCTEICLRVYPGPSGPFRSSVDKFLIKFFDTPDEALNIWSGKCMHLLQQVRGGGVHGMSHKAAWLSYQQKLLTSLHNVFDFAFSNCTELFDKPKENNDIGIADLKLDNEPVKRAAQMFVRFRNLINYLIIALRCPFPVAKPVSPKKILILISRGLNVTWPILQKNPISDNLAIGTLLPKMHILLLDLLKNLILTLRSNLKPHHLKILSLIVDTLHWTSSKKNLCSKTPINNLRSKAYELLSLWCTTMQNGSRVEVIAETLMEEIISDTVPLKNGFTLKVLNGSKKHMTKKARRQLHKAQNEQSNLTQSHAQDNSVTKEHFTGEERQKVCIAALKSLQQILLSAANFLKPTLLKMAQIKIMEICGLFYALPTKKQLYHNWECRLEVYKVMHIFILRTHHLCPPPIQMTVYILQTGHICDSNAAVRMQCADGLLYMEKLIHPNKENLLFPNDVRDIRNTFERYGQECLLTYVSSVDGVQNEFTDNTCETDCETPLVTKERQDSHGSFVELTPMENNALGNAGDIFELDSSSDSIEIVENTGESNTTDTNKHVAADYLFQSKSPELILRVDEDSIELKENSDELKSKEIFDGFLTGPVLKKQRLEAPEDVGFSVNNFSVNDQITVESEENMLAEIEATFVDELN